MGRDNVKVWPGATHQVDQVRSTRDVVIKEDSQEGFLSVDDRPILIQDSRPISGGIISRGLWPRKWQNLGYHVASALMGHVLGGTGWFAMLA
jgi:hypothetical protein